MIRGTVESSEGEKRVKWKRNSRVTLSEKPKTTNNVSPAVGRERAQRVALEHSPDVLDFPLGLGVGLGVDPFLAAAVGQVGLGVSANDR